MSKLRVHSFLISVDGYGAGPMQDLDNPLGVGGEALHEWMYSTRSFNKLQGSSEGKPELMITTPTGVIIATYQPRG